MTASDFIQTAILAALTATFVVILVQMYTQNRMLKAQLLRDRFETYWQTVRTSVSDDEVRAFHTLRDDYIDSTTYAESYEGDEDRIRKYISLLNLYEYLAFAFSMRALRLPDPLGYAWTERWAKDLLEHPEFLHVHEYHKKYYPEFATFVDDAVRQRQSERHA